MDDDHVACKHDGVLSYQKSSKVALLAYFLPIVWLSSKHFFLSHWNIVKNKPHSIQKEKSI